MTPTMAIKRFTVQEGPIQGGRYMITVQDFQGRTVDGFEAPTMQEAYRAYDRAGYEDATLAGGSLIVALPSRRF